MRELDDLDLPPREPHQSCWRQALDFVQMLAAIAATNLCRRRRK